MALLRIYTVQFFEKDLLNLKELLNFTKGVHLPQPQKLA
jgi:hypothetical protein